MNVIKAGTMRVNSRVIYPGVRKWHLDLYELKVITEKGLANRVRIGYTE